MSLQLDDLVYKLRIDDSELDTGSRQASQALGQLNAPVAQASRGFRALGESSKLTRQEMLALNFTVSDTVSSLASGMSPLTILLQQGPQVRDAFGGIGNALRGIGSLITPAVAGFGTLALVAGTAATAFIQGALQSDALEKAINRTGNAAGVTAGQFDQMVKDVAAAGDASEGASRRILLGLVRTGQVGPQALQAAATAAAAMAKAYDMTEEEVVKSFQGMSKGVADWAAEQNKTMNFLTLEQYRYIRSLEDQGKTTEAQLVLFERLREASARVTTNLGSLERGWNAVGEAAGKAWQWMLGIGREATLEDRLAKAQAALADAEKNLRDPANNGPFNRQLVRGSQEEVEAKRETVRLLQQQIAGQRTAAGEQARAAADNAAAIAKEREREKERERKGPRQKPEFAYAITDPIADQKQAFLRSEITSRDEIDKALAARDERAAKEALQAAEKAERQRQQRLDQLMGASDYGRAQKLREEMAFLSAQFDAGQVSDVQGYIAAMGDLQAKLDAIDRPAQQAADAISTFTDQARRNMQDLVGDNLYQIARGNFQGIAEAWGQMLLRMLAQAQAARLNEALFGAQGSNGQRGGGLFDVAVRGIAGWLSGSSLQYGQGINGGAPLPNSLRGGGATGTNELQRDMVTLVHKGEAIVPKAFNPWAGGKGLRGPVTINNYAGAQVETRERDDGGLDIDVLTRVVEQRIAGNVAGGRGAMSSALKARGLNSAGSLARMGA